MYLNKIKYLIIKFFCVVVLFNCLFSATVFSQTSDLSFSRFSFARFHAFSAGLVGLFEQFKPSEYNVNISNSGEDELIVQGFGMSSYQSSRNSFDFKNNTIAADQVAEISGDPLVYPNPFRQSSQDCSVTSSCARLVYELVKAGPIEIHFYDMLSNLIFSQEFVSGSMGAMVGVNQLIIDSKTFIFNNSGDKHFLSAGVYFYLIMSQDSVIGKGKMVVKP